VLDFIQFIYKLATEKFNLISSGFTFNKLPAILSLNCSRFMKHSSLYHFSKSRLPQAILDSRIKDNQEGEVLDLVAKEYYWARE
jgi:hypothetical protein